MATLPFLYEMSSKYPHWFDTKMLADMIAVSESTPGPIGVNMATYAGYTAGGLSGALCATVGLVLPSIIVIIIVAGFLDKFSENPYVKSAFYGLRPAVTALIAAAGYQVFKISVLNLDQFAQTHNLLHILNIKNAILFALLLFLIRKFNKHPIFYIIGAAVLGILLKL